MVDGLDGFWSVSSLKSWLWLYNKSDFTERRNYRTNLTNDIFKAVYLYLSGWRIQHPPHRGIPTKNSQWEIGLIDKKSNFVGCEFPFGRANLIASQFNSQSRPATGQVRQERGKKRNLDYMQVGNQRHGRSKTINSGARQGGSSHLPLLKIVWFVTYLYFTDSISPI